MRKPKIPVPLEGHAPADQSFAKSKRKLHRGSKGGTGSKQKSLKVQPLKAGLVLVVKITSVEDTGILAGFPLQWPEESPAPKIQVMPGRRFRPSRQKSGFSCFNKDDHILVRLQSMEKDLWRGEIIKQLEKTSELHLGIFTGSQDEGGRLSSCHRKDKFPGVSLTPLEARDLQTGDILAYEVAPHQASSHTHKGKVTIHHKIGHISNPQSFSQMAIISHGLPHVFSPEALALSNQGKIPALQERSTLREDLRSIPLVTIDGEDARDFDDAVWAKADENPANSGGWHILVAIADVAYYVRPGDALDQAARERGNSVYFPDRVVPMLPEGLSNDLCSLKPQVDRACMAIRMVVASDGKVKSHQLIRGLMRSRGRLTYTQVQGALDGALDEMTAPLLKEVIQPLYGAYQALFKARLRRGTLDLEQIENQFFFGDNGLIERIAQRPHYESHRLIEEFMIAANVAAAQMLATKGWPCLYRVHDSPDPLRVANLRQILSKMKISFTKTAKPRPEQFNDLLTGTKQTVMARMIGDLVLRSQAQARYSPLNIGHYGLSLSQYAHFTSPIRRYADLVVHRALISAYHLGEDGLPDKHENLSGVADHISTTERQAATAERDVRERFITAYHAPHIGDIFPATIVGVNKVGLFVVITDTGAQGFIPRGTLREDIFYYEEESHRFIGQRTKKTYQLGDSVKVLLHSADIATNSLVFEIISQDGSIKKYPKKSGEKHKSYRQTQKIKKRR